MKTIRWLVMLGVAGGLAAGAPAQGLFGGAGQQAQDAGPLAHLLGKNLAFTATATISIKSSSGGQETNMESPYAVSEGKLRMEMDLSKAAPQAAEEMKKMGMDRMINISRPDKNVAYVVYPGLKSYCEMTLPDKSGGDADSAAARVEKTEVGKETIDGHACVKNKVVITTKTGQKMEGLVWEATDLSGLPLQSQFTVADSSISTMFRNVKMSKPDAALFEPPQGFKKYGSMQELMMGAMQNLQSE